MGVVLAHSRQEGGERQPISTISGISATYRLLRQRVHDTQGQYFGKSADLLIRDRRISHVVVSMRGPLGFHTHYVSIPIEHVCWREDGIHLLEGAKGAASHFEYGQLDASGQ
jgi:hypothetical protein